jgi:hypothetical protein
MEVLHIMMFGVTVRNKIPVRKADSNTLFPEMVGKTNPKPNLPFSNNLSFFVLIRRHRLL